MKNTTLCYIERDGKYLMLLRNKKSVDENKGKWIGVGGKFEEGESPEECVIREVKEETGLAVSALRFRGLITFVSDEWGTEYLHLFTAESDSAEFTECSEGELAWKRKEEVFDLNLWEGDRIFLRLLLEEREFFSLKYTYRGDELVDVSTFADDAFRRHVQDLWKNGGTKYE